MRRWNGMPAGSAASGAPMNNCGWATMFNQRVVTAAVLAPLFLAAVYLLDTPWFSLIMAAVMCPAAWEWSRLAGLQGRLVRLLYLFPRPFLL